VSLLTAEDSVHHILIVEDDPTIQGLLDEILRDEGFETVIAADG